MPRELEWYSSMENHRQIFEQVFYRRQFPKLFAMYFEANEINNGMPK